MASERCNLPNIRKHPIMSTTTMQPREGSALATHDNVQRWPSERPLFAVCVAVSALLWLLLTVSVIGLLYALFLALFFFVMHLGFIAHVRGRPGASSRWIRSSAELV